MRRRNKLRVNQLRWLGVRRLNRDRRSRQELNRLPLLVLRLLRRGRDWFNLTLLEGNGRQC